MNSERVAIYIDGSNFYKYLRDRIKRYDIDFSKLAHKLCQGRKLTRIYYYNCPLNKEEEPDKSAKQQKFFNALEKVPYFQVELGRLEKRESFCRKCKDLASVTVEKGVDVKLAVQMISQAYRNLYDTAILISGDGDFAPAIDEVKNLGKHVEVATLFETRALVKSSDVFILINSDYLKDCWI